MDLKGAEPHPAGIPPLPELPPAMELPPGHATPVSSDLRRGLEGGIETLEVARARYALLRKSLRGRRWRERTAQRLEALRELIRQEPEVEDALARLYRRAQREHWPGTEPALGLARKVERLRSRLRVLTCERLRMRAHGEPRLVENLAHIEQLLSQTMAAPVSSEERVLHQGAFSLGRPGPRTYFILMTLLGLPPNLGPVRLLLLMGCSIMMVRSGSRAPLAEEIWLWRFPRWREPISVHLHSIRAIRRLMARGAANDEEGLLDQLLRSGEAMLPPRGWTLLVKGLSLLMAFPILLRREFLGFIGRFWLTRKRLAWQYGWRAPIHIPLHALCGIQRLSSRTVRLVLVDGRSFRLTPLSDEDTERLVVLLNKHCSTSPAR